MVPQNTLHRATRLDRSTELCSVNGDKAVSHSDSAGPVQQAGKPARASASFTRFTGDQIALLIVGIALALAIVIAAFVLRGTLRGGPP